VLGGGVDQLESDKFEASLLESGDDGANQTALNTIGLWQLWMYRGKSKTCEISAFFWNQSEQHRIRVCG
jgi:hypothetical protein